VLLDRLDHAVVDRRRHGKYLRYCDDLAMFGDDLGALADLRAYVDETLASLRLKAHPRKSRVRRVDEGLTFLGFVVRRGSIRLGQVGLARFRARRRAGEAFEPASWAASWAAWRAHVAQGTTRGLVRRVLEAEAARGREHAVDPCFVAGQALGFAVETTGDDDLSGVRAPAPGGRGGGGGGAAARGAGG
jgi:hypothetical protein